MLIYKDEPPDAGPEPDAFDDEEWIHAQEEERAEERDRERIAAENERLAQLYGNEY